MRKFLLKVSIFVMYALLLHIIVCVWVDPFNVFHWDNIRVNGVTPNKNYIKMKYILANPDKFDSFIFGSSRVGAIHNDKIQGEIFYNMTCPSGIPEWHLMNIKTFLKNGIYPKKIYIGIDSLSYIEVGSKLIDDPMRCPYEYFADNIFHFVKIYFDPAMINSLLDVWLGKQEGLSAEIFYKYGWDIPYKREVKFNWSNKRNLIPAYGLNAYADKKAAIASALEYLLETIEICRVNNIELILFTNPMHYITYMGSVKDKDYFKFLEGLAEISDFWNFSSLNDITLSNNNYLETSHYKAEVGDLMIDIMCNGKSYPELQAQGFGVKVTRENVKDFIAMIKKQAEDYEKLHQ